MNAARAGLHRRFDFITAKNGRSQRLRLRTYCQGKGVEIGALHRPLPLPKGATVQYLDRLPTEELRRHYPELDAEPLVPVSVLATAEDLSPIPSGSLDFVVANHLLEHCENPIRALLEFERVLTRHGTVYLALPDPRFTFDSTRALTSVEHLVDDFQKGPERSRLEHYLDWATNVDHRDREHAEELLKRGYSIHFHVWTRETFPTFLDTARALTGLKLEIIDSDSGDDEFIFVLRKGRKATDRLWQLMPQAVPLRIVAREIRAELRARVSSAISTLTS